LFFDSFCSESESQKKSRKEKEEKNTVVLKAFVIVKAQSLLKDVIISGVSTHSANCSRGIAALGG
jgi:hypothetical protein